MSEIQAIKKNYNYKFFFHLWFLTPHFFIVNSCNFSILPMFQTFSEETRPKERVLFLECFYINFIILIQPKLQDQYILAYFVDNDTAGSKESLELFFFNFQQKIMEDYQNFKDLWILKVIRFSACLPCYLVRTDEVSTKHFHLS